MKEREYGIDLLRIISMFMVVVLHVLGVSGVLKNPSQLTFKGEILWGIEISCLCAVNVFALISGYIGYSRKHKYSNIIYLSILVAFYAITITGAEIIISIVRQEPLAFGELLFHFFTPVNDLWYFSAYFCLFFFMPLLNFVINKAPRKILQITFVFIMIVFSCITQIHSYVSALQGGYSFLWLAILYTLGGYIGKYKPFKKISARKSVLLFIICILITILSRSAIYFISKPIFGRPVRMQTLISYTSPTILFAAIFLLNAFSKLKFKANANKLIGLIAPLAFSVYVIHYHPFILPKIGIFAVYINQLPVYYSILITYGLALAIFIACLIIDYLRSLLFKVCKIKQFSCWLEKIIGKFICLILKLFKIELKDNEENLDALPEPKTETLNDENQSQ